MKLWLQFALTLPPRYPRSGRSKRAMPEVNRLRLNYPGLRPRLRWREAWTSCAGVKRPCRQTKTRTGFAGTLPGNAQNHVGWSKRWDGVKL